MALFSDLTKEKERVLLDGNEFLNCTFLNCQMVYQGGEQPRLRRCQFTRCSWHLEEAAQRTVRFLRNVFHSGPGGRDLVEETLRHIRMR